jgi:hypothetical protein
LYLVRAKGLLKDPQGALDAALRRADDRGDRRRGHDEEERDLALRRELEHFLGQCLKDADFAAAVDLLDRHLPPKVYGDQDRREHEADDEHADDFEHPDHEKLHEYAVRHGLGDDAEAELGELVGLPHNAMHGQGGRVHETDDRRRADDRHRRGAGDRRMASDATDSFNKMFPGAARIGLGAL